MKQQCSPGGARRRQSSTAAVERGALHGGARWRTEIWVWAAAAWCGTVQGGAQGPNKGGAGIWTCVRNATTAEIAGVTQAEETDRVPVLRDLISGW